jgi:hypothetical protein
VLLVIVATGSMYAPTANDHFRRPADEILGR